MESLSTQQTPESVFDSLHTQPSCTKPSVIVVGSGIAGLAAASALQRASFKVTLLESRERIGGRILTDDSFGCPVDMGASWLHGASKDNPLASLIVRLGLPLYRTSGDNSVLYDHDLESYALFDTEGLQIAPELVAEVGEVFKTLLEETKNVKMEFAEDISVAEALSFIVQRHPELRQKGLAHQVLQWYLCRMEGWFGADAKNISVQSWVEEDLLVGGHGLMVGGYAPVITSLAEGLDIRLSHRVSKVIWWNGGVRVITEDCKVFDADAAIIAVPLGVLKANLIKFEPSLPDWKEKAIVDLAVGNENKIALFFETVFWPNVEFLGVVASTSYGCSYFLNLHKATGHPVLVYIPAGSLADDIESLPDEAAVEFAFLQLKKILQNAVEPLKFLVSRWGTDKNSLGCFSYGAVGRPHSLYDDLQAPVQNLFFAGEATSHSFPSTVHGAFATGILAASECRKRFETQFERLDLQPVRAEDLFNELLPLQISRM